MRSVLFLACMKMCVTTASLPAMARQAAAPTTPAQTAPAATPEAKTLKVGDPAPALNIAHWAKGEPIKGFEKDRAYVVEFWATWCGPCIQNIPHLTKLQKTYKDKGLTVIGVSSSDRRGIDDVRPFVERMGKKMGYTIAVDNAYATGAAYMSATGQNGIPVAYVVDKSGKLAWYGHPQNGMDEVVEMVVEGNFDAKTFEERVARKREFSQKLSAAIADKNVSEINTLIDGFKAFSPRETPDAEFTRFVVYYSMLKDHPKAVEMGTSLLANELKDQADFLGAMVNTIAQDPEAEKDARALALACAKRFQELTLAENEALANAVLSEGYRASGDLDRAILILQGAIDKASDAGEKKNFEVRLSQYKDELTATKSSTDTPAPSAAPAPSPAAQPK